MRIAMLQDRASVPSIFSEKALARLASFGEVVRNEGAPTDENVKKTIAGADIAITSWGNTTLHREILDCAPGLRLIVHAAGSIKPIVCDEVWERGIRVTGSPKPLGMGVAETALGFTISASKNYYNLNANLHANGPWHEGYDNIRELYDLTVGVIGAGWAGGHYLELMQNFGVETLLYDPYCSEEKAARLHTTLASFEEVLRRSDIISIHAPNIPETYHMFNAETLGWMKKDAVLINTARGAIVDEHALYEHMAAGNLKYACLDVFDPEPMEADNPLRTLPNVILTPHLAGLAQNGKLRIGMHAADEIEKFLSGRPMDCEATKEMLAKMA
ncbi:MAG: hydroxyacid dehydrogenase [Eubacteriales bacterium]